MDQAAGTQDEDRVARMDWRLWGKIFRFALAHRRSVAGLVGTAILLAAADATLTLVPRGVINQLRHHGDDARFGGWLAVYAGLSAVFCACVCSFIHFGGKIWTHVAHDIRGACFGKLQDLSFSYYDRRSTGWLIARVTSDCTKLTRILAWGTLDLVWGSCFFVGLAVIMLVVNPTLAVLVLATIGPLAWVSLVFQRRILGASREARRANSDITAAYNEGIAGVRTTKTLVREAQNLREFDGLTGRMYGASVRSALYSAMYIPIVVSVGSLGVGLALWYGGVRTVAGTMELGDVVLFINIAVQLVFPIQELSHVLAQLQGARAAAERVVELLDAEPEIQDSPDVRRAMRRHGAAPAAAGLAEDGLPDRIAEIRFENVSFAYKQGQTVLSDFTLTVSAGQTIALVGPTGGGKSTIVSLMCRFYEPTAGRILIDGTDYRRRSLRWLQSSLGIVLQAPHLFSGTIRENLRYGRLDATDDQIEAAARLVNAHEFIHAAERGYDTEVGEGGASLSTGQKQLISFARAVLADPKIFVMDEATSSVDTQTERLIQQGLREVLVGRISFVIAHRLSTIRSADRILVIEGGRIVEDGDHRSLLARRGRYHELYTTQFARGQRRQVLE